MPATRIGNESAASLLDEAGIVPNESGSAHSWNNQSGNGSEDGGTGGEAPNAAVGYVFFGLYMAEFLIGLLGECVHVSSAEKKSNFRI